MSTEVPRRKDWYGTNPKEILHRHYDVFGFRVSQFILPVDSSLVIVSANIVKRENSPNKTLYVRGLGRAENNGTLWSTKVPGIYSGDRPDHPKGVTKLIAIEELEFWCFNWHDNRGKLPDVSPIRLTGTNTYNPGVNKKILVCYGKLNEYTSGTYFISTGEPLTVTGDTYGFIFN